MFARLVSPALREAVLGVYPPESYEEWKAYPHVLLLCADHYKALRSDRVTLGYRKRHGRVVAYVKAIEY